MSEQIRDKARAVGLDRLTDEYLAQFDRATSGDLAFLGIAEAAELIRAKKLSPVEYTKALLAQIEQHDSKFNAFIALTPERALTAAREAEAEITAGSWRGPLHGVPYALKDIIDVEGIAT